MSIVFNTVAKPSGSLCNLSCKYCFYLDKPRGQRVMSDDVLETYIRRVIDDTPSSEVSFCWQGESRRYAVFLFTKKWCACSNAMPTAKLSTTVCKLMAY
ncbi:Chondro-6-sulfatase [Salmonella enterica subsp. enterica]|nr:Chondro-6-sulfatase [Salmonella enterica subsp. enterica]